VDPLLGFGPLGTPGTTRLHDWLFPRVGARTIVQSLLQLVLRTPLILFGILSVLCILYLLASSS
jgi:hypothetical protein